MPSTCPKCHQVVPEDVVCCADLYYVWKCTRCHKVATGFAVPYGKCFMCGGELRTIQGYDLEEPMAVAPVRDAVQFELNAYHFYRLALQKAKDPVQRAVLEELYQKEVDHLHTLQERYHAHLDDEVLNLRPGADTLLSDELFEGVDLDDPSGGTAGLYDKAILMENRTREHFRRLSETLPEGPEKAICLELAAEEDEHVALLETEREQFLSRK